MIDYTDFSNQFILVQREQHIPAGWCVKELGRWLLGFHATLPITEIQAPDSSILGWLLGYPIDESGKLVKGTTQCDADLTDKSMSDFESWLYGLGGTFAAILITPLTSCFYLDSAGSLPVVFSPESEIVASTPSLIADAQQDGDLIETLGFPEQTYWFPFGLTPKKSVERLVPSHCLDLNQWTSHRHWPANGIKGNDGDTGSTVQAIADLIRRNIGGVASAYQTYMSLTAGQDSRALLACARDIVDCIVFYTWKTPDKFGALDFSIAAEIARRFNLKLEVLQHQKATEQQQKDWLDRTGNCVGGRVFVYHATNFQLNPEYPLLTGVGGEVGRAYYFNRLGSASDAGLTGEGLLELIDVPRLPELVRRANRWLEELSGYDTLTILDILYIEQILGCWDVLPKYGNNWNLFQALPFCHRGIFELVLSLPEDYRTSQTLGYDLIRTQWPELLKVPINNYRGIRGLRKNIRRLPMVRSLARTVRSLT